MNALKIIAAQKGAVALQEIDVPAPGKREVQVRAAASVVSPGTERAFINAMENTSDVFPQNLGYSCAGVVERVGEEVSEFRPGDRVAGIMFHQSRSNAPAEKLVPVPKEVAFDQAAFIRIGVIAMQAVRKARIELGEAAVVIGMGLIGQNAAQLCRANGAYPVICVDKVESKLRLAKKLGADFIVNAGDADWLEQILSATGGSGAPIVIECTGFPQPINSALLAAKKFGRVIILGSTRGNTEVNFYRDVHKKALTIIGAHISSNPQRESYPGYWSFQDNASAYLDLIKAGRIDVDSLVSEKRGYRDYQKIYERVLGWDRDYITTIIDWE